LSKEKEKISGYGRIILTSNGKLYHMPLAWNCCSFMNCCKWYSTHKECAQHYPNKTHELHPFLRATRNVWRYKGESNDVIRRRVDNAMAKTCSTSGKNTLLIIFRIKKFISPILIYNIDFKLIILLVQILSCDDMWTLILLDECSIILTRFHFHTLYWQVLSFVSEWSDKHASFPRTVGSVS
jgi:hypothetical protein